MGIDKKGNLITPSMTAKDFGEYLFFISREEFYNELIPDGEVPATEVNIPKDMSIC